VVRRRFIRKSQQRIKKLATASISRLCQSCRCDETVDLINNDDVHALRWTASQGLSTFHLPCRKSRRCSRQSCSPLLPMLASLRGRLAPADRGTTAACVVSFSEANVEWPEEGCKNFSMVGVPVTLERAFETWRVGMGTPQLSDMASSRRRTCACNEPRDGGRNNGQQTIHMQEISVPLWPSCRRQAPRTSTAFPQWREINMTV